MNRKTAAALEDSIAHWRKNAEAKTADEVNIGPDACALCDLFNYPGRPLAKKCAGCPVTKRTGQILCCGTPYDGAASARLRWFIALRRSDDPGDAFRDAALAEVAFLESLREPSP
jgi:hypothetical protein